MTKRLHRYRCHSSIARILFLISTDVKSAVCWTLTRHSSSSWSTSYSVRSNNSKQRPTFSNLMTVQARRDFDDDEGDFYYDDRHVEDRNGRLPTRPDDDFYVEYDDEFREVSTDRPKRGRGNPYEAEARWMEEDEFDSAVETREAEPASGNFWFNPKPGLDLDRPVPVPGRWAQMERDSFESTAPPHRRRETRGKRPSKTTFRSGTPPPPAPVSDFYNRLFWYGFDPADSSSPADPTMFGGTKGKFNGLAYLQDGVGIMPPQKLTRQSRSAERNYWDEEDEVEPEWDETVVEEETFEVPRSTRETYARRAPVTPPYDPPQPMRSAPTRIPCPPPRNSRRHTSRDVTDRVDDSKDWVSNEVSSWFRSDPDDDNSGDGVPFNDDGDEYRSSSRRRKRRSEPSWSFFGALETFLGLDREDPRADEYDQQMGLGRRPPPEPRSQRARSTQRTKGYAYRFRDDDDTAPVVELEVTADVVDSDEVVVARVGNATEQSSEATTEMSWEERALSMERVPPVVPAWGPTGDLGMDARTKAILDAMEDINLAKQQVDARDKEVDKAKEDIAVLRVDAELEKKRLRSSVKEARVLQAKLRRVDLDIQDASRALRYSQQRLRIAQDELAAVERRHWAVLSFYNPKKVEQSVNEAIREFEESEPAARLHRQKAQDCLNNDAEIVDKPNKL